MQPIKADALCCGVTELHSEDTEATKDYVRKLEELDRLLNDPDVPIQPELIWCLLDEVAKWKSADTSLVALPSA
jgi:hypothetical protein